MKKRLILLENYELKKNLECLETTISNLKNEISKKDKMIEKLELDYESLTIKCNSTQPLKDLAAKVIHQATIEKDVEYGASVIGKTVIEAAKCCNMLTGETAASNAKELLNLILGRTEVTKAEILKIVSSDSELEQKMSDIDTQYEHSLDYFKSVTAQIN